MAVNPVEALINKIYAEGSKQKYFDPSLAAAVNNARLGLADINRSYGRGVEEAGIGYDETARQLLKSRDENLKNNTGQFAGQGILKSGIFATEQGKVGENYQQGVTQAAQRKTSALQELANSRLAGYNELQRMLRTEQGSALNRAAAKRQEEANRKLEAYYRGVQQQMAQQALAVQKQQLAQQKALAGRSGGGGGGGGGGGMFTLESLFPGMFAPPPKPSAPLKTYSPKPGKTGARTRVM